MDPLDPKTRTSEQATPLRGFYLWRRRALNLAIGAFLVAIVVDALPQSPPALHGAVEPILYRLAINQGAWNLFAPSPDRTNMRMSAEIVYRDGERRAWRATEWGEASAWEKWTGHRHFEWQDHIVNYKNANVFEPWCRRIAREARPDFAEADRGAEVKLLYEETEIRPPSERPWRSFREKTPKGENWVLTIERLE